jgi:hypothetical protein
MFLDVAAEVWRLGGSGTRDISTTLSEVKECGKLLCGKPDHRGAKRVREYLATIEGRLQRLIGTVS